MTNVAEAPIKGNQQTAFPGRRRTHHLVGFPGSPFRIRRIDIMPSGHKDRSHPNVDVLVEFEPHESGRRTTNSSRASIAP